MPGAMSIWHWLIVLAVVVVIFGARRLRGAGGDLGAAVREFRTAIRTEESAAGSSVPAPARHNEDRR
jgi:sec-independent protein translocase protein TatA